MARIGFSAIDIYLYTDDMARDCGAFSCLCGVLCVGWWCVYGCIKVCSVSCGGVYVYMYLYNALVACGGGGGGGLLVYG